MKIGPPPIFLSHVQFHPISALVDTESCDLTFKFYPLLPSLILTVCVVLVLLRQNSSFIKNFFLLSLMLLIYFLLLMGYMHFGLTFLSKSQMLSSLKKYSPEVVACTGFRKLIICNSNADKWTHLLPMQRDCNYYFPSLKVNCNLRVHLR